MYCGGALTCIYIYIYIYIYIRMYVPTEQLMQVCAQKWADLSEHGFGVMVLNDGRYGYSTLGNIMKLSL